MILICWFVDVVVYTSWILFVSYLFVKMDALFVFSSISNVMESLHFFLFCWKRYFSVLGCSVMS